MCCTGGRYQNVWTETCHVTKMCCTGGRYRNVWTETCHVTKMCCTGGRYRNIWTETCHVTKVWTEVSGDPTVKNVTWDRFRFWKSAYQWNMHRTVGCRQTKQNSRDDRLCSLTYHIRNICNCRGQTMTQTHNHAQSNKIGWQRATRLATTQTGPAGLH
jgi:hypothetical protein